MVPIPIALDIRSSGGCKFFRYLKKPEGQNGQQGRLKSKKEVARLRESVIIFLEHDTRQATTHPQAYHFLECCWFKSICLGSQFVRSQCISLCPLHLYGRDGMGTKETCLEVALEPKWHKFAPSTSKLLSRAMQKTPVSFSFTTLGRPPPTHRHITFWSAAGSNPFALDLSL